MSRVMLSLLSATLLGLVALAVVPREPWLVALAVVLVQVMVASAPTPADVRRERAPRFVPVVAGSLVATVVALKPAVLAGTTGTVAGRDAVLSSGVLAGILPGVAVVVACTLVGQMLRRDGRGQLVATTGYAVALGVLAVLASGWVAASHSGLSDEVVPMAAVGTIVGLLVWSVPGDRVVVASAALTAGALAGAVVPLVIDEFTTWLLGVAVGGAAAFCGVLGQVIGRSWSAGRRATTGWGFPAALSVALVGPVVHLATQLATLAL